MGNEAKVSLNEDGFRVLIALPAQRKIMHFLSGT
jgi:hypothetical protein